MREVIAGLFVGSDLDCPAASPDASPFDPRVVAVLHCCKSPCHARALGYTSKGIMPDLTRVSDHPGYLVHRVGSDMYLNMIDGPARFFSVAMMKRALDFLTEHAGRTTLIHCNQGVSRAPSIGLLYLTKRLRMDYSAARAHFPDYMPSPGIEEFLTQNWAAIE
jgi:hypothetical protein